MTVVSFALVQDVPVLYGGHGIIRQAAAGGAGAVDWRAGRYMCTGRMVSRGFTVALVCVDQEAALRGLLVHGRPVGDVAAIASQTKAR